MWAGMCGRCGGERQFRGEYIGKRWDGKLVINGVCLTCQGPQVVVGVREEEEEEGIPVEQFA